METLEYDREQKMLEAAAQEHEAEENEAIGEVELHRGSGLEWQHPRATKPFQVDEEAARGYTPVRTVSSPSIRNEPSPQFGGEGSSTPTARSLGIFDDVPDDGEFTEHQPHDHPVGHPASSSTTQSPYRRSGGGQTPTAESLGIFSEAEMEEERNRAGATTDDVFIDL